MAIKVPPGPRGLPFLGSILDFRRDSLSFMERMAREFGDIASFTMVVPWMRFYFLNHPDLIREVLVDKDKAFVKSSDYEVLKAVLGEGLLTSERDFHRRQRRLVQPAFHRKRIAEYGNVMTGYTAEMESGWDDGATVDV